MCLPQTSATTTTSSTSLVSAPPGPTPTASPLPPVSSKIQTFIDELSTALLYAELISNGGNSEKLCSVINPSSLDQINGIAINGSAVQAEVCALGAIDFDSPSFATTVTSLNQKGVSYLATALFAIQVAGNYAGGCNLATLCSEIEATLIDNLFINYIPNVGTEVKNYVCSAASASSASSSASKSGTPAPTSATSYPTGAANANASCTTPTGFANTVVPAPRALATTSFQIAPSFASQHTLFIIDNLDARFSEAAVASFCLDQCIAYQPNSTTGRCLSFNVNLGKPIPPTGNGGPTQWFCTGFDAYLAEDGSDYAPIDAPGSYMFGLGVNRVCGGTYRAY